MYTGSVDGVAWLSWWCGVAQLVVHRLAVRQARVRFSARHHREVFPHWADKRRGNGERPQRMTMDKCIVWMWLNEWMYVWYKIWKINKKEWHPACHQTFKKKIKAVYRRARGERRLEKAKTIALNCGESPSPSKIEYNCRYFLMKFRKYCKYAKKISVKMVSVLYRVLCFTAHRPIPQA